MNPNMKDVINHLSHGKDPLTAWNKALQDGLERDQKKLRRQSFNRMLRGHNMAKGKVHKTVIVTNIMKAIPIGTKVRMVNCLEAENPKNQHDWGWF